MQDRKMKDHFAGRENAGLENVGIFSFLGHLQRATVDYRVHNRQTAPH